MSTNTNSEALDVEHISSDDGSWILASTQADAEQWCGGKVEFVGWAYNVGWDRERYKLRREFREETGYRDWWEISKGEAFDGGKAETRKCRPAWKEVR